MSQAPVEQHQGDQLTLDELHAAIIADTETASRLSDIDSTWETKVMRLLELHEKGTLTKANPWDEALKVVYHARGMLEVLLQHRGWSQPHVQFALRICYAIMDLHSCQITDLRDFVIKSVNWVRTPEQREASQQQRSKRGPDPDDGDRIPTNAKPDKIRACRDTLSGGGLFHVREAQGDTSKISALHVFNLSVCGGANLAYDLSADPAQLVADYQEVPGDDCPNLGGLLPLLEAAVRAPVELGELDAYLPDASDADVATHCELEALIAAQTARVLRGVESGQLHGAHGSHALAADVSLPAPGASVHASMGASMDTGMDADMGAGMDASMDASDTGQDMHVYDDDGGCYDDGGAASDAGNGDVAMGFGSVIGDDDMGHAAATAEAAAVTEAAGQGSGGSAGSGDVRSELAWLLHPEKAGAALSWARPQYWRFGAAPGACKQDAAKPARQQRRQKEAGPPPTSLNDPRFAKAAKSTCMSEAMRAKRATRSFALQPAPPFRSLDSLFLLGKPTCRVDDNFRDLCKTEWRPRAVAHDGGMHDDEGFGDVWADAGGDADDDGWAGGDFAGFAAGEEAFVGEDGGDGVPGSQLWAMPETAAGAGGLTPLTGGLTPLGGGLIQVPTRRPRMKAKYDLSSKYVDVRAVKDALLEAFVHFEGESAAAVEPPALGRRSVHVLPSAAAASPPPRGAAEGVEMKAVFNDAQAVCGGGTKVAGALENASVHVKFICMLHIANEKNLALRGATSMDQVVITRG